MAYDADHVFLGFLGKNVFMEGAAGGILSLLVFISGAFSMIDTKQAPRSQCGLDT